MLDRLLLGGRLAPRRRWLSAPFTFLAAWLLITLETVSWISRYALATDFRWELLEFAAMEARRLGALTTPRELVALALVPVATAGIAAALLALGAGIAGRNRQIAARNRPIAAPTPPPLAGRTRPRRITPLPAIAAGAL